MDIDPSSRPSHANQYDWKRDYFIWVPLMVATWRLAWKFQDPFISDWDGFDYTVYAVKNLTTTLGLGRALFTGYNHVVWQIAHRVFDVPIEQAYLVFRYGVIAQSGPAIVGLYALSKELTASRFAAALSALIVAFSPFFITYSGRVMNEIPALLLFSWSFWFLFRSLRQKQRNGFLLSALLIGVSANIREFSIFYLWVIPVVARHYNVRWRTTLFAVGLAVFGALSGSLFWALYRPDYYLPAMTKWWILAAKERQIHNLNSGNFWFLRTFAYQCSTTATLVAPFAFFWLWGQRHLRPLLVFGLAGLLATFALLLNHDLPVNPRYLLLGLPGLAAVSGWGLARLFKWREDIGAGALILLIFLSAGVFIQLGKQNYDDEWNARAARRYLSRIDYLPSNSVFVVGARTPLVNFYIGLGARSDWKTIQPGSGWPDAQLSATIARYLAEGRPIFVDFDRDLWHLGEGRARREEIGLEVIRRTCRLEMISDHLYRILRCNPSDESSPRV